MIRYDVLWHDLVRDLNEARMQYALSAERLDRMKAKDLAMSNSQVSAVLGDILKKSQKEFGCMKEKDEEAQHNANVTLQEILKELKKLNKGKEDEKDGLLNNHGDGFGDDAGDQGNAERDQSV